MRVLVTGGAGYIGSVIAARLLAAGHAVTVYDDLSRGHRAAVPAPAAFVRGDIRDERALTACLTTERCKAIVHMAALAEVAESVAKPDLYRDVNVVGTAAVAAAALTASVRRIVLSSTAAVYGDPIRVPIEEDDPLRPVNPYGESKLAAESVLREAAAASGGRLTTIALRYFNAAGADGPCGEDHDPESHLIPSALRAARDGSELEVFGNDYPTADGTCIRDYVHVVDLAEAHIRALTAAAGGACNLGTGSGDSVNEVLATVRRVTGLPLRTRVTSRRPGDPPILVASSARAREVLGWQPRRSLEQAVADAWRWLREHPRGYAADAGGEGNR